MFLLVLGLLLGIAGLIIGESVPVISSIFVIIAIGALLYRAYLLIKEGKSF